MALKKCEFTPESGTVDTYDNVMIIMTILVYSSGTILAVQSSRAVNNNNINFYTPFLLSFHILLNMNKLMILAAYNCSGSCSVCISCL